MNHFLKCDLNIGWNALTVKNDSVYLSFKVKYESSTMEFLLDLTVLLGTRVYSGTYQSGQSDGVLTTSSYVYS